MLGQGVYGRTCERARAHVSVRVCADVRVCVVWKSEQSVAIRMPPGDHGLPRLLLTRGVLVKVRSRSEAA